MRINNNIQAMNTHRQLAIGQTNSAKSMEKLSSGLRINKAGDDAAGLAISEKMRGQIRGLGQASRNAQDGISLVQTAEGALQETQAILQRMRELSVQSSNDTNATADRTAIQGEFDQLSQEIDRIGDTTEFNTKKLLNGGAGIQGTSTNAKVSILEGSADIKVINSAYAQLDGVKAATTGKVVIASLGTDADILVGSNSFTLNETTITFTGTGTIATDKQTLTDALNAVSDTTGVTAAIP